MCKYLLIFTWYIFQRIGYILQGIGQKRTGYWLYFTGCWLYFSTNYTYSILTITILNAKNVGRNNFYNTYYRYSCTYNNCNSGLL